MFLDDNWISSGEAEQIMSERHGRPIRASYINILAHNGFIQRKAIDGRTYLFYRPDVEAYHVQQRPPKGQGVWKTGRSRNRRNEAVQAPVG